MTEPKIPDEASFDPTVPAAGRPEEPPPLRAEASAAHHIRLTTNSYLNNLVEIIKNSPVDWGYIFDKLGQPKPTDFNRLIGVCMELHLWHLLEQASELSEFKSESQAKIIDLDPLSDIPQSVNYRLRRSGTGTAVDKLTYSKGSYREYDAVIRVGGLLVVIESKAGMGRHSSKERGSNLFKDENIQPFLEPLQELTAADDFGFVFVTLPEVFARSPIRETFKERGGIIVDLPTKNKTIKNKVISFIARETGMTQREIRDSLGGQRRNLPPERPS